MNTGITVRHPTFDFNGLPQDWVGGSRLATLYGNAGHVFVPLGEEFFIDTVREFRDDVHDDELRAAIKAFIGQEATHKRAHEGVWSILQAQGVPIDVYERAIASVRSVERFLPAKFRLSVTTALEHYTAVFGHLFLTEDLALMVPDEMARLLAWHGLEELEHRSVAFDLLQLVDDSYLLRIGGFAFATGLLIVVPVAGVTPFAVRGQSRPSQGRPSPRPETDSAPLREMSGRLGKKLAHHVRQYLKPQFHPSDLDLPPEAELWADRMS